MSGWYIRFFEKFFKRMGYRTNNEVYFSSHISKKPVCGVITETDLHGQKTIHDPRIMGWFADLNMAEEIGFFLKVLSDMVIDRWMCDD